MYFPFPSITTAIVTARLRRYFLRYLSREAMTIGRDYLITIFYRGDS